MDSTDGVPAAPRARWRSLGASLKTRIALVAGVLALAAVGAATRVTVTTFADDAAAHGVALQRDAAQRTAQRIAERLDERMQTLEAIAGAFRDETTPDVPRAVEYLDRVAPVLHGTRFLAIVAPDGRVRAQIRDGRAGPSSLDLSDRPYIQRLADTRRPVVSDAVRSRVDGRPVVALVHPAGPADGRIVAAFVATIPLDDLGEIGLRANPETRTVVLDREGRVVGYPDPRRLLEPAASLPELRGPLEAIGRRIRGNDLMGGGRFGDDVVGWAAVEGTGWLVFEIQDANALLAGARAAGARATNAALALGLIAAAAMFAACLALMRPLDRLRERALGTVDGADRIDAGWPDGADEVGELSRAFRRALGARAEAEAEQARASARLGAIIEHLNVGVVLTRDFRIEMANPAVCRLLGGTREGLVGRATRDLCPDDATYAHLVETTAAAMARDGGFDVEFQVRRLDGSTRTVRTIGSMMVPGDPTGGTLWSIEDVTARRAELEQLALAREVIDRAHEAIVVTDDDDRVIRANPAFLSMSGRSSDTVLGAPAREVGLEPLPDDGRDAFGHETAIVRTDGTRVTCWASLVRLERAGERTLHIRMLADIGTLKAAQHELRRLAMHDPLTGLPNRAGFRERLAAAVSTAATSGQGFALLYVDLDGFKGVNDRFGHDGGDELLRETAARLQRAVRGTDTVCRLGGDEFTVIADGVSLDADLERVCLRVLAALSSPVAVRGHATTVGASIGACTFPFGAASPDALVLNADAAMYAAKRAGKGRWSKYRPDASPAGRATVADPVGGSVAPPPTVGATDVDATGAFDAASLIDVTDALDG